MIKFENVFKSFGPVQIFKNLDLLFPENRISVVLGPSGCGKTTLLNLLAGLQPADQGLVAAPAEISYLFQEPRLLPWLTVFENIALVLRAKTPASAIDRLVRGQLTALGVADYAGHYPAQLSGGLRQRAAMARAFVYDAPLLLMDEPFKSLDVKMQFRLIRDFLTVWQKNPKTVIGVTHDPQEALWLADEIFVFPQKPVGAVIRLSVDLPHLERARNDRMLAMEKQLLDLLLQ